MSRLPAHIEDTLKRLAEADALRQLRLPLPGQADFTSNDYLGLAKISGPVHPHTPAGASGSRLLSGNHAIHEALERRCARLFRAESALAFGSGYLANISLLSAVATRHDTFLYDQAIHASMKDGMRLSSAKSFAFRHNDLAQLESLLQKAEGAVFVLTEALFSMDGDSPDLAATCALCKRHGAYLIVDEAHSTGIYGNEGEGLLAESGLENEAFARVHTFGKAVGRAGAVVLGSERLRAYLINRARAFIYTTAMPDMEAAGLVWALEWIQGADAARKRLWEARARLDSALGLPSQPLPSPILPVLVPGNAAVKAAAAQMQADGLDVRPILAPTVPEGGERLRIVLHAFNTDAELDRLAQNLRALRQ